MSTSQNVIALFDILGFRERVRTTSPERFGALLDEVWCMTGASLVNSDFVGAILISDSIVLYGKQPGFKANIVPVGITASNLLNAAARFGFPLRGALSLGPMFIDQKKGYVVGSPLVDAYDLEQQQEWMGAVVDPKHEDEFAEAFENSPMPEVLVRYPAPMKSGLRRDYLCVSWTFRLPSRETINAAFRGAETSHDAFRKQQNTLAFFDRFEAT